MDGLAVFDYDDGGESEYRAPSIGRQKQVRPTNWSAEVELVLDTTYTGASSQEKEDKILADVKEALVGKFITLSLRRDQAENPHQKVPVPPPFTNEGGSTKPI